MAKFRTKKAAAKRFSVKASGKVRRNHAGKNHILTKKARKRKNKLKKAAYVEPTHNVHIRRCLPNG